MVQKIQYYVNYAKAIIEYAQKIISIISVAAKSWPKWIPPIEETTELPKEQ